MSEYQQYAQYSNTPQSYQAGPRPQRNRNSGSRPWKWVLGAAVAVVLIVVGAVGGYIAGGVSVLSDEICPSDAKDELDDYEYISGDFTEATGPKLSRAQAGDYYLQAIDTSWQAVNDVMLTSFGDDLSATREAARSASKSLAETATMLRARTWPDSVASRIESVARDYESMAKQATAISRSVRLQTVSRYLSADWGEPSDDDANIRDALGLDAAKPHTMPVEIVALDDRGEVTSSYTDATHVVDVTVRSNVPGTLTDVSLGMDLLTSSGEQVNNLWGELSHIELAHGQSAVISIDTKADYVKSGMKLRLTQLAVVGAENGTHAVSTPDTVPAVTDFRFH
ncbi:hypothetical protein D2E25_0802 [Bifidobacterium goeldii]|uniref:Uncharacterized protein n=2 Tax=Bifidobacterium goeldii TaxID=2306975 RepID=A0A430FKR0_9BIFI|nr:hypothetical protein D2E25_0802 [Bifidobacterium goeldii]